MIPERQPEGPYLSFHGTVSGRHATLEDEGYSAWLYLTNQSEYEVIADCFVYSRVEPPDQLVSPSGKNGPPLLTREYASASALQHSVPAESLRIEFSSDGNSAVVFMRTKPWALVTYDQKHGYSKSLSVAGPFGYPWDEQLYHNHFPNIQVG